MLQLWHQHDSFSLQSQSYICFCNCTGSNFKPCDYWLVNEKPVTVVNNFVAVTETVEVGCLRHPGATNIGKQLQDGDRTDGWQNLTTEP